jgi:hypothetical protein
VTSRSRVTWYGVDQGKGEVRAKGISNGLRERTPLPAGPVNSRRPARGLRQIAKCSSLTQCDHCGGRERNRTRVGAYFAARAQGISNGEEANCPKMEPANLEPIWSVGRLSERSMGWNLIMKSCRGRLRLLQRGKCLDEPSG